MRNVMINKKIFTIILTIIALGVSNSYAQLVTPNLSTDAEIDLYTEAVDNNYKLKTNTASNGAVGSVSLSPPVSTFPSPNTSLTNCPCSNISMNYGFLGQCIVDAGIGNLDRNFNGAACDDTSNPKIIGSFNMSTSAASFLIQSVVTSIEDSGIILGDTFKTNGEKISAKIGDVSLSVAKSLTLFKESMTQSKSERGEKLNDIKMNYMAEIKERELRARNSEFALDDTAEEIAFIEYQLNEELANGSDKPQIMISKLKSQYDDQNFVLPIKIRSSDRMTATKTGNNCEEYDPSTVNSQVGCFYYQKSSPGNKLEMIFNECSRAKKQTLMALNQKSSSRVISNTLKKEQTKSMGAVVTTENIVNNQLAQRITSCNDKEFGFDLCADELQPEEYIEKVVMNEIIPNGNVSATNLLTPPAIGSYDGETDLSGEELISSLISSLEKDQTAISENTPPLINTYKTSSQYFAAKDFITNILNRDVVSNQSVAKRQNVSSSKFQSKYNQREAALSLAEQVLNSSIENRIGGKIKESLNDGDLERDVIVRESLSDAGYLDVLEDMVNDDYSKLVVGVGAAKSTTESLSRMAPKSVKNWQYNAQVLNTKLKLENQMDDEQIELLLATYLGLSVNSSSNIQFLETMKVR